MDLYCNGGGFKGSVDEAVAKQSLLSSLGNRNVAREVLTKASSPEAVGDVFMADFGPHWLVSRGYAIMAAVLAQVLCVLFCLFSLCRCCAYERPTRRSLKNYAALVIVVVLIGLFICTIGAIQGYSKVHDGLYNVQCTSVRLFDVLLKGEEPGTGSFRGLLPVLDEFEKAETTLDHGSQFMQGMEHVLEMTDDIKKSATLVSETMLLLQDMLKENRWLHDAAGKDLLHECKFCVALGKTLDSASAAFSGSPASRLAGARAGLEKSLTAAEKERMKGDLRESAQKLVEIKSQAVGMLGPMLEDGGTVKKMKDAEHLAGAVTLAAVLLVSLVAFLLSLCAGISIYRFTFHEMDPALEEQGGNPYNPNIHKYAHTTWCCGFFYVTQALLVAGVIFVVSAPVSSFCLLMDDLDSTTMRDIAPALGMDQQSNDAAVSAPEVVDRCFHPSGEQPESYFLDILFTERGGQRVSHRQSILSASRDAIESKFAQITEGAESPAPPVADSAEVKALLQALGFADLDAMLTGAAAKLKAEDDYADMAIPKAGLVALLESSIACEDLAVPPGLASPGAPVGATIPGIKSLAAKLASLGQEQAGAGGSCAARVACTAGGFAEHACKAGNRYLDLKARVRSASVFRCDMFQAPGDPTGVCDPLHMRKEEGLDGVIWSDDCLGGGLARKQRTCSLPEFAKYVRAFGPRLEKVLQRLDEQMEREQPSIGSTMRMLMEEHVLHRSDFIANGVTCKFFASYYQELINGSCYQGVYGLRGIAKSYVWCALLAAMLIFSMYAVWCRSKGNIENWNVDRTEYKALLQKEKDAEEARKKAAEKKDDEEATTWILVNPNDPARREPEAPASVTDPDPPSSAATP